MSRYEASLAFYYLCPTLDLFPQLLYHWRSQQSVGSVSVEYITEHLAVYVGVQNFMGLGIVQLYEMN